MSGLRDYFVVMPVVVEGEPNAHRIEFKVGNQMFRFGPEYCEDREHAEWFVDMAIKALQTLIDESPMASERNHYKSEADNLRGLLNDPRRAAPEPAADLKESILSVIAREDFEAWTHKQGGHDLTPDDCTKGFGRTYRNDITEHAWRGWASGRSELVKARASQPPFVCPLCKADPCLTVWHDQACDYAPTDDGIAHVGGKGCIPKITRPSPPPGALRDGGLRDLVLALRPYLENYDCADAAELEAKNYLLQQCSALTKEVR